MPEITTGTRPTGVQQPIAFVAGLASVTHVTLVGTLFGTDLILIGSLPFLIWYYWAIIDWRLTRIFLILLVLWGLSAVVTDVARLTPPQDYFRGWAKILFFGLDFLSLTLLTQGRIRLLMAFFAGIACAAILSTLAFPEPYQKLFPWKFGYATPVALIVYILGSQSKWRGASFYFFRYVLPLVFAILNLLLNFRSMWLIMTAVTIFVILSDIIKKRSGDTRLLASPLLGFGIIIGILGSAFLLASLYGGMASSGTLGVEAQEKYYAQNQGDLGLLLGGRSESLVTLQAIKDSPLLGHGSWAKDRFYVALRIQLLREHGVNVFEQVTASTPEADLIPTHSYLLGAWVEAGIMGAVFWAFCFLESVRGFIALIDLQAWALPFCAFLLMVLMWSIPFSPFGAEVRFYVAGQLCLLTNISQSMAERRRAFAMTSGGRVLA